MSENKHYRTQHGIADVRVGDRFTITMPERRKWWQFWQQRGVDRTRTYIVTARVGAISAYERAD